MNTPKKPRKEEFTSWSLEVFRALADSIPVALLTRLQNTLLDVMADYFLEGSSTKDCLEQASRIK